MAPAVSCIRGRLKCEEMNQDPMARLTDDTLVDIISRVPYKSTCCCKCVSTRWRDLISHPDHRKKMPQTLAGFFYETDNTRLSLHFTNVSGQGESLLDSPLSFLPPKYENVKVLDCCNGLLLCRCWKPADPETLDYVVCNPATEKWVVVPATVGIFARLGFEPAVSSHFHVFEFVSVSIFWVKTEQSLYAVRSFKEVRIYSSKTGVWSHKDIAKGVAVPMNAKSVFLRGTLYLSALRDRVVAVDIEGSNWRLIPVPKAPKGKAPDDIYLSQGQLHLAHKGDSLLSIWVLQDTGEKWTWKYNVNTLQLFRELFSSKNDYKIISIHPERNVVFIVGGCNKVLLSYNMDSREVCFIRRRGWDCMSRYIPYVPLFSNSLAHGH
uniref:Uncharacterized protein n=1 Tax=Avena sativa TaxID=4498 RepID=A0ACD5WIS6_AVESA